MHSARADIGDSAGLVPLIADRTSSRRDLALVLFLYLAAMCLFALLHPVLEWPDAEIHLTNSCQGDGAFPPRGLLAAVGQDVCSFSFLKPTEDFRFFSNQTSNFDLHTINPIWAYIFLPLLCLPVVFLLIARLGNHDAVGNPFLFAPPLAFYFANINIEVFGLFMVVAAYFLLRTRPGVALILTFVATAIDRSHVCSVLTIGLLIFFRGDKRPVLLAWFLVGVFLLYIARLAGLLSILDVLAYVFNAVPVLGVTGTDIIYNAEFGGRGYAALLASAAGLYGAMSYRPAFWIVYYGLFFMLVAIGYRMSSWQEKKVLYIAAAAAMSVMLILPPLSQARYFPIFIISIWSMALKGGTWFGIPRITLQLLFFCWTMFSLISLNLSHLTSN